MSMNILIVINHTTLGSWDNLGKIKANYELARKIVHV